MKQRLRNRNPHGGWNLTQVQEAVQDIWDNKITVKDFNNHIDRLFARIDYKGANKKGSSNALVKQHVTFIVYSLD
jgi:hypothetical protein